MSVNVSSKKWPVMGCYDAAYLCLENVAPEEKNRIFIEYGTVSEAQRAYNELNDQYINDNEVFVLIEVVYCL